MNPLERLNAEIIACTACARLVAHREAIAREKRRAYRDQAYWGRPVPGCGDPQARVLLVGLAPGAHGSNRTGRMFTGDGSGDFLTPALHRAGFASQPHASSRDDGLTLTDLYMAAVAHCVPPDNKPSPEEIAACRPFLLEHLRRLPRAHVLLALGQIAWNHLFVALESLGVETPRPRLPFAHGAECRVGPYVLVGSYHPSRQNTQTGRLTAAMLDAVLQQVRRHLA